MATEIYTPSPNRLPSTLTLPLDRHPVDHNILVEGILKPYADALEYLRATTPTTINVLAAGAKGDRTTDDHAVIMSAFAALKSTGGTLELPDCDGFALSSSLDFTAATKPIRIKLGAAGLVGLGGCGHLITANRNIIIEGHSGRETLFKPQAGFAAVKLAGTWGTTNPISPFDGAPFFQLRNVGVSGGTCLVDAWTVVGFYEGYFVVDNCYAENTTDWAVKLGHSVYYGEISRTDFNFCFGSALIKDNTETKLHHNTHKRNGSGKWAVALLGSHRITIDDENFNSATNTNSATPNVYADVLITSAGYNLGDGVVSIKGSLFDTERVWIQSSELVRIDFDSAMTDASAILPNASITSGSHTLTLAGLAGGNVGEDIVVRGAGSNGGDLYSTISAVAGSTVTLADAAGTTVSQAYAAHAIVAVNAPNAAWHVNIIGSRIYGQPGLTPVSISRNGSNVATVTLTVIDPLAGTGLRPNDQFWLMNTADVSFDGKWTVSSVAAVSGSTQAITFGCVGSSKGTTASGGQLILASSSGIRFRSPPNSANIESNAFANLGFKVDDSAFLTESNVGQAGNNTFRNNKSFHALGVPIRDFAAGGKTFTNYEPEAGLVEFQPTFPYAQRIEFAAIQNFVSRSEDFTHVAWNNVGITVATTQTDPWGSTRASKVTRAGAGTLVAGYPPGGVPGGQSVWALTEGLNFSVDLSSSPKQLSWSLFAAADPSAHGIGDLITLFAFSAANGYLTMRTFQLPADGTFRRCVLHVGMNRDMPGFGGANGMFLGFVPGVNYVSKASCFVVGAQADEYGGGPYAFTNGAVINDATAGMVLERDLSVSKMRSRNRAGKTTTVGTISATIGSTGTSSIVATDMGGYFEFTPSGSGIGNYVQFIVTYSEDWNGQVAIPVPVILGTTGANAGSWENGSTLKVDDVADLNHSFKITATHGPVNAGGSPAGANFVSGQRYRVGWLVGGLGKVSGV